MLVDPDHAGIIAAEHLGTPSYLSDRKHSDAVGPRFSQPGAHAIMRQARRLAPPIDRHSPSQGFQVRENGCLVDTAGFKGATDLLELPAWDRDLDKPWPLALVTHLPETVVLAAVNCET